MSYFPLTSKDLKAKGLKNAIVYRHEKGTFEVWLSGRNREVIKWYSPLFTNIVEFCHDKSNGDAIVERVLTDKPDFDNQEELLKIIVEGIGKFIEDIYGYILEK